MPKSKPPVESPIVTPFVSDEAIEDVRSMSAPAPAPAVDPLTWRDLALDAAAAFRAGQIDEGLSQVAALHERRTDTRTELVTAAVRAKDYVTAAALLELTAA